MIGTALTAALTVAQLPVPIPIPDALLRVEIEVVVQTTRNHFAAENESFLEQLLLLGTEESGPFATVRLGPGGRVVYPFPRGTTDDLWVEVIAVDGWQWRNTGALSLRAVRESTSGALWIQSALGRSVGWIASADGVSHLRPESGLCGNAILGARPGLRDYRVEAATHIPVPIPNKDEKEGPPPVLDKKPLPPV